MSEEDAAAAATGTGKNRYRCAECGKGFITPSKLQRHTYSHTGQRPYHCDVCGKSFSQSANLKTHIKNTHPDLMQSGSLKDMLRPTFETGGGGAAGAAANANFDPSSSLVEQVKLMGQMPNVDPNEHEEELAIAAAASVTAAAAASRLTDSPSPQ